MAAGLILKEAVHLWRRSPRAMSTGRCRREGTGQSSSVRVEKHAQGTGTAVAGDDAACSCDIDMGEVIQTVQILVDRIHDFLIAAGMSDEYAGGIRME